MGKRKFLILPEKYYKDYHLKVNQSLFKNLHKLESREDDFDFYITTAATYSCNIEGNGMDVDTYMKYLNFGIKTKSKDKKEIDNLREAYIFAKGHSLNLKNLLKAHGILSKTLMANSYQGKIREQSVAVYVDGKIVYVPVEAELVREEMNKLFADIEMLGKRSMNVDKIFYYASMIHLVFEKIHPFMDGNGRAGRLLEKWFLAEYLSKECWYINSEKYYNEKRKDYFIKVHLGPNYDDLDWSRSINFALMLPESLKIE